MLSVDGDADASVANRIRIGWNKFRQLVPLLTNKDKSLKVRGRLYNGCVWSSILHGSETWPIRKENEVALQRAEMRMVRWMCGVKLQHRIASKGLLGHIGLYVKLYILFLLFITLFFKIPNFFSCCTCFLADWTRCCTMSRTRHHCWTSFVHTCCTMSSRSTNATSYRTKAYLRAQPSRRYCVISITARWRPATWPSVQTVSYSWDRYNCLSV